MIYYIVRFWCWLGLKIFTKKIFVDGFENIPKEGPVLLASNHPNSFLDAVIINTIIRKPTWSLARGDAFKSPMAKSFLNACYMMPIYRLSEGKEYLKKNDDTFNQCFKLFKRNQSVLIFSEGICKNQTSLLPLKKGTGRLARQIWEEGVPLKVVPVGVSYNSYSEFGKVSKVAFGRPLELQDFNMDQSEGFFLRDFNKSLEERLKGLAHQQLPKVKFYQHILHSAFRVINFPLYFVLQKFVKTKTKNTIFYDSVLFGAILITVPLYLFLLKYIIKSLI